MKETKKKEKKELEKALFIQRFVAYIIDIFIVSMISSILMIPFTNTKTLNELTTQSEKIADQYVNQKIDMDTYVNQSMDINYEISRQSGFGTIISIAVYILYFVVFQFYNKGQTLGKKLMKIQVIPKEEKELSLNQMLLRSAITNAILVDFIILLFTIFAGKDLYLGAVYVFESIQSIIILASVFMIMYRKDGRTLPDLIAHTRVVRLEVKEKELEEVCES